MPAVIVQVYRLGLNPIAKGRKGLTAIHNLNQRPLAPAGFFETFTAFIDEVYLANAIEDNGSMSEDEFEDRSESETETFYDTVEFQT